MDYLTKEEDNIMLKQNNKLKQLITELTRAERKLLTHLSKNKQYKEAATFYVDMFKKYTTTQHSTYTNFKSSIKPLWKW